MKAENLKILKENGLNVPAFIIVENNDIDLSFSKKEAFAVRSSFYLEDTDDKSFAGQFKTILNVKRKDIKDAVKKVRESYPDKNSPVIIQEMIQADYSGVIFTANPLGILNEIVITVGKGLGEKVVDDKEKTTTYYYNKDEDLFFLKEESNLEIKKDILVTLIQDATKIKEIFKKEMDIEFAIKENTVYILQARPITTMDIKELIILDNSNIVESYPGISLPLTQDFAHTIYEEIFKACIERLTSNSDDTQKLYPAFNHMVTSYNGAIYYEISNWYEVLQLLPFSNKIIKVWQEMLGVKNYEYDKEKLNIKLKTKLTIIKNFIKFLFVTPRLMDDLNKYFDKVYIDFKREIEKAKNKEDLLLLYKMMLHEIIKKWDVTLINDMYAFIYTGLSGGKKNNKIANIKNIESMKPVLAMNYLYLKAEEYGKNSEEYKNAKNAYIDSFGDRIFGELKLETKTYRTNPELLDKDLKFTRTDIKRVESKIRNPFVKRAKLGIANREVSRLNRTRIFGLVRMLFLRIGEFLKENGQIKDTRDVFYLYIDELQKEDSFVNLIEKRKEEYKVYASQPHPRRIVFANNIIENKKITLESQFDGIKTLTGTSTSLGKVEGEALIIETPDTNIDTTGKIIVTKSTDPGWVFLIENCLGIITEQGSLLSHTAIISRELKKPAIVNVKDATKIIKQGQKILLDANIGTISILGGK